MKKKVTKKKIFLSILLLAALSMVIMALSPHEREVINAEWNFEKGLKATGGKMTFDTPCISGVSELGWTTLTSEGYSGASGFILRDIDQANLYTFDADAITNAFTEQTTAGAGTSGVSLIVIIDINNDHGKIFGIQNRTPSGTTPAVVSFYGNLSGDSPFFVDSISSVTEQNMDAFGDVQWYQVHAPPNNPIQTGNSIFVVNRYIH